MEGFQYRPGVVLIQSGGDFSTERGTLGIHHFFSAFMGAGLPFNVGRGIFLTQ